jgi:uncharacterized protein YndB with AHSA1/START domain
MNLKARDRTVANALQVSRLVPASPERVFRAWTEPAEMKNWWGPKGVNCASATVDLRVGGQYRIANEFPDGSVIWISGLYEFIDRPHLLIYTWNVENKSPCAERVKVHFEAHELGTRVTITHEKIATKALTEQHQQGWTGCLDGLIAHLAEPDMN